MKIVGRLWRRLLLRVFPRKTHRERKIDRNRVYWWREKSKKKKQLDKDRQAVKRRLETNGSLKRARKGRMKAAKSHQKSRFGICASLSSWFVFLLLKMTRTRLVVDYHRLGRERGGQKQTNRTITNKKNMDNDGMATEKMKEILSNKTSSIRWRPNLLRPQPFTLRFLM